MTRGQRLAHARIWMVLAPALVLAVLWSLATRGYPAQAPPAGSAALEASTGAAR